MADRLKRLFPRRYGLTGLVLALVFLLSACDINDLYNPPPLPVPFLFFYYPKMDETSPCQRVGVEVRADFYVTRNPWFGFGHGYEPVYVRYDSEAGTYVEEKWPNDTQTTLQLNGPAVGISTFYMEKSHPMLFPPEDYTFNVPLPEKWGYPNPPTPEGGIPSGWYQFVPGISYPAKRPPATFTITLTCVTGEGQERGKVRLVTQSGFGLGVAVAEDLASPTGMRLRTFPKPLEEYLAP